MRPIDADRLNDAMYHEAFETDSEMQKWDSGCWIRYKMFENHLDEAPTIEQPTWIPCSERLPSEKEHTDGMVLVCYADGSVRFNTFMNWQWVQGEPIAWMPLPKPWKGADDE